MTSLLRYIIKPGQSARTSRWREQLTRASAVPGRCILSSRPLSYSTTLQDAPPQTIKIFEPPYLHETEPQVAMHPPINIQMTGYDYTTLQSYQGWVARTCANMGYTITGRFASPCQNLEITRLKKKSDVVDDKFHLNLYQRTVQVSSLPAPAVAVVCEVLQAALPEGVQLCIDYHQEHHDQIRHIPDLELRELRRELDDLGGPTIPPNPYRKK